ncbi:unnamed protein product [Strongylus vulgaris]|uniref:Uncharacterized protein n=1 Tax=Strongylus vulgaris TaxID=40348 RepID=A0A3P7ITH6_STRVU|nr:unnamed protein product [Strongylus vulgaris]
MVPTVPPSMPYAISWLHKEIAVQRGIAPSCPCPMNLYDVNLCPSVGVCYRESTAVTYALGPTCTAMLNCPAEYYVKFLLESGGHLDNRDAAKTHKSPCKICSSIERIPKGLCPPNYTCLEPLINTVTDSTNCEYSVIECPGSDMVVQLKSGSSSIVYRQDVRCDGTWIYHDGHRKHQVENMLCLIKG